MKTLISLLLIALLLPGSLLATPKNKVVTDYLKDLAKQAKKADPKFAGFTAEAGKEVYHRKVNNAKTPKERSCVSCHNENPTTPAKHIKSGKAIKPLAPIANRKRFTSVKKIEKWFKRNCKWTFERECTAKEKGDFIEYIYTF